jgi:protein-histidine pros-kinase
MKSWWRDTLGKRLFVLMWVALVLSHLAAFQLVTGHFTRPGPQGAGPIPTLPSLPPTPGMPPPPEPGPEAPPGGRPPGPPELEPRQLALDYGARLLLIGLAAWLGARWLSAPMRRLAVAAAELGRAIGRGRPLPRLDDRRGTFEVRETARVFNRMADELDHQFRSRELLMAALSHDLRTPLTHMRLRLEAMGERPDAARCVADIRLMDELIDTALDAFRSGGLAPELHATDLMALVQSIADDHAEQGANILVVGSPVVALADPLALRRVLMNLIGNALRYGQRAEVRVEAAADRAGIVIDDFGPGIPSERLEDVLRPFVRVEGSRSRATGGAGLGLYIAKDLLERMDGTLVLSNRRGGGLRVEVTLATAS